MKKVWDLFNIVDRRQRRILLVWWGLRIRELRNFPLILISIAWLAGIVLAAARQLPPIILFGLMAAVILVTVFQWSHRERRLSLLMLCFLCAGAWRYTLALPANDPQSIVKAIGPAVVNVNGNVSAEPRLSAHARILTVAVTEISPGTSYIWKPVHGTIEVVTNGTLLEDPYGANYGDSVTLYGKVAAPSAHTAATFQAVMDFPGISISSGSGNPLLTQLYHLRVRCATIITRTLPQPLAALLIAIVLGLRTPALTSLAFAFNVTGTAHLIVPSGFKVTIVAGLITSGTRWLYTGRLATYLPGRNHRLGEWLQTLLVIVSIALYTLLSGAGAAALRAGVMGSLLVLAPRIRRTYDVYTALAFTALVMSVQDPTILWDTGFLLSFLGTLGIVLFTPTIQQRLHFLSALPGGHMVAETGAVTLAAQLATLPIFALTFQQVSFIAPFANMLTVPLLGILVTLGLALCFTGLVALPLAQWIGRITWPLLWYTSQTITWCASLPHAYLLVKQVSRTLSWFYYIVLILAVLAVYTYHSLSLPTGTKAPIVMAAHGGTKRKVTRQHKRIVYALYIGGAILLLGITALVSQRATNNGQLTISFLNVGPPGQAAQGEAILVQGADGSVTLIDGGPDATSLAGTLDSHFPPWQRSIDLALLTVPRTDHLTGLQDAITRYSVQTVVDAGMLHPNTTYVRWRRTIDEQHLSYATVGQGQSISIGTQLHLEILWPPLQLSHKGSNEILDDGMIVRLVAPNLRLLLLGATAQSSYALKELLQHTSASELQAEIVQVVGGKDQTLTPECIDVIRVAHPSLLVVTPPTQHQTKTTLVTNSTSSDQSNLAKSVLIPGLQEVQTGQTGGLTVSATAQRWTITTP